MKLICNYCNKEFRARRKRKYCCQSCANKSLGEKRKKKETMVNITTKISKKDKEYLKENHIHCSDAIQRGVQLIRLHKKKDLVFKENLPFTIMALFGVLLICMLPLLSYLLAQVFLGVLGVFLTAAGVMPLVMLTVSDALRRLRGQGA